jgi:hypothetical protein
MPVQVADVSCLARKDRPRVPADAQPFGRRSWRPAYTAEALRSSLATSYGSPAKAIAELAWHRRDLDSGLSDLISAG